MSWALTVAVMAYAKARRRVMPFALWTAVAAIEFVALTVAVVWTCVVTASVHDVLSNSFAFTGYYDACASHHNSATPHPQSLQSLQSPAWPIDGVAFARLSSAGDVWARVRGTDAWSLRGVSYSDRAIPRRSPMSWMTYSDASASASSSSVAASPSPCALPQWRAVGAAPFALPVYLAVDVFLFVVLRMHLLRAWACVRFPRDPPAPLPRAPVPPAVVAAVEALPFDADTQWREVLTRVIEQTLPPPHLFPTANAWAAQWQVMPLQWHTPATAEQRDVAWRCTEDEARVIALSLCPYACLAPESRRARVELLMAVLSMALWVVLDVASHTPGHFGRGLWSGAAWVPCVARGAWWHALMLFALHRSGADTDTGIGGGGVSGVVERTVYLARRIWRPAGAVPAPAAVAVALAAAVPVPAVAPAVVGGGLMDRGARLRWLLHRVLPSRAEREGVPDAAPASSASALHDT